MAKSYRQKFRICSGEAEIGKHHPPVLDTCLSDSLCITLILLDLLICVSSRRKLRLKHLLLHHLPPNLKVSAASLSQFETDWVTIYLLS
jgi:hypothetical protein